MSEQEHQDAKEQRKEAAARALQHVANMAELRKQAAIEDARRNSCGCEEDLTALRTEVATKTRALDGMSALHAAADNAFHRTLEERDSLQGQLDKESAMTEHFVSRVRSLEAERDELLKAIVAWRVACQPDNPHLYQEAYGNLANIADTWIIDNEETV